MKSGVRIFGGTPNLASGLILSISGHKPSRPLAAATLENVHMSRDAELTAALVEAARRAFTQVRAEHPAEVFYCFALCTSADVGYIEPTCSGEQGLREVAQDYVQADGGMDREGCFGDGAQRNRVLVTVLQGDQSDRSRLRNARRLNPAMVVQRLAEDLQIPEPIGSFTTLGSRAVYQVVALTYAPARSVLAACGSGGEVFAWDLARGRESLAIRQDGECWAVALSPDGQLLVAGDGAEIVRLDLASGARTRLARLGDKVSGLDISPDGTTVIAGGWDDTVTAFETHTGKERWRLASLAKCVRFSPNGQLLALAGAGVTLVDPADGSVHRRLLGRPSIATYQHLAWSPDARTVAIGSEGPRGQRLSVWRWQDPTDKPRPFWLLGTGGPLRDSVCDLAFSPSGALLASAHAGGDIHVWEADSGEHRLRLRGRQESMLAVVFIDERRLAAAGQDVECGPPVDIWDL